MTNYPASFTPYETNAGMPGAAPLGTQMQGNPNGAVGAMPEQNLPGNQNSSDALTATQLASGNISANSVPINVNTAPGTDSLLAQISRGQLSLGGSTTFQSSMLRADGGTAPAGQPSIVPQPVRTASSLTYPAPGAQNHTGS